MSLTLQDVLDVQTQSRQNERESYASMLNSRLANERENYRDYGSDMSSRYDQRDYRQDFRNDYRDFRPNQREDFRFNQRDDYRMDNRFDARGDNRSSYANCDTYYRSGIRDNLRENYRIGREDFRSDRYMDNTYAIDNYRNDRTLPQEREERREINYFGQSDPIFAQSSHPLIEENGYYQYLGNKRFENSLNDPEENYTQENVDDLFDRLSYTSSNEKNARAIVPKRSFKSAKSSVVKVKNVKGKIILAVYIAVLIIVASLIIVSVAKTRAEVAVVDASTSEASYIESIDVTNANVLSGYEYIQSENCAFSTSLKI